ncbi:MAG: hypothetical protein J6K44_00380, partial [Clostridia bacterium]|nr:hypothetical protein [Clostridia bacterium]
RLDRDTSGLLVFAKDEETKLSLQENWEDAVLERRYTANFDGTALEWQSLPKGEDFNALNTQRITVHCSDGDLYL